MNKKIKGTTQMNHRKILAVLLALVCITAVLTSCGGKTPEAGTSVTQQTTAQVQSTAAAEQTTAQQVSETETQSETETETTTQEKEDKIPET